VSCDQALAALVLDRHPLEDGGARAHLAGCARCQTEAAQVQRLTQLLAAHRVPAPPPGDQARTLVAAAPLLARRAAEARVRRRRVARALALALLPLPLLLFANVQLLMGVHRLLLGVLPAAVTTYLVACLGGGIALLLALSYVSVPVLAARRPWSLALEDPDVRVPA
jgi:hypothetical protein